MAKSRQRLGAAAILLRGDFEERQVGLRYAHAGLFRRQDLRMNDAGLVGEVVRSAKSLVLQPRRRTLRSGGHGAGAVGR